MTQLFYSVKSKTGALKNCRLICDINCLTLVNFWWHHNETTSIASDKPNLELYFNLTETTLINAEYQRGECVLLYQQLKELTNKYLGIVQKLTVLSFHFKFLLYTPNISLRTQDTRETLPATSNGKVKTIVSLTFPQTLHKQNYSHTERSAIR